MGVVPLGALYPLRLWPTLHVERDRQEILSCHSKANKATLGSSAGCDPKTLQAADLLDGPLAVTA
jgi:hypothetical protein